MITGALLQQRRYLSGVRDNPYQRQS
jgi:hypothetical protein